MTSDALSPGTHTIEITVNNGDSIPLPIRNNSHACTESTQTNWNGIIGEIRLSAMPRLHIKSAIPFPQTDSTRNGMRRLDVTLSQNPPAGYIITAMTGDDEADRIKLSPTLTHSPSGYLRQTENRCGANGTLQART